MQYNIVKLKKKYLSFTKLIVLKVVENAIMFFFEREFSTIELLEQIVEVLRDNFKNEYS